LKDPDEILQSKISKAIRLSDNHHHNMTGGEPSAQAVPVDGIKSLYWELSQISCAPGDDWETLDYRNPLNRFPPKWQYSADDSFGRGQTIYVVEDNVFNIEVLQQRTEFSNPQANEEQEIFGPGGSRRGQITQLAPFDFGELHKAGALAKHGTQVTSRLWGLTLGLARKAKVVLITNSNQDPKDPYQKIHERYLESLIRVLADVVANHRTNRGTVIVNMSFGWSGRDWHSQYMKPAHHEMLCKFSLFDWNVQ
jgi:hypothetical protein